MATTYNIRYKNHCTPQAQVISGGRYYLDSDCGRKLTGDCSTDVTIAGTINYEASKAVTATGSECEIVSAASNYTFVFVKNTGSVDIWVTLNASNYHILLSEGEAFASEIDTASNILIKTASGTSTIEHYEAK
tara:strand:- start:2701 stop:3099 length:399 start_codon:yes stop_codon:yes gene_type:complete